ncbi:relaxase/mobilization nuclease family protein (plasmid) [Leptolyngbya sp. NIES-3755]|nr:relaxase/mobilization nuclease family protein [Leptolyngbya sp. NIES-3755]
MTPNVVRGSGFYGCLAYVFSDNKAVGIVATNMIGRTPAELSAEFEMVWQLNLRSPNPVWHVSLSLHPSEVASHERWKEIVETFIEKVGKLAGLDETAIGTLRNQYVAVLHGDRNHPHVHLILNRVNVDGEVCYCKWDHNRTQQACREIEKELGLIQVRGQAIETEPNQFLTHDAIAILESQFEQTGVLDPALERYQIQHNQRLEEQVYERQLHDTIESDQTGDAGRSTTESIVDRTCESVARFVELFNAAGDIAEADPRNRKSVAENRSADEQAEPSRAVVASARNAVSKVLYGGDFSAIPIRSFSFSPRTFTPTSESIRSADPNAKSGNAIAQTTNAGLNHDRRSLTERFGDRVGDFSNAIAASLNHRRAVAVERDRASLNLSSPETSNYDSTSPEFFGWDGASIGKRVARSLEADFTADSELERSDYDATARNSETQRRESNTEDATRNAAADQSNRNWQIAQEFARFAEDLQRSSRAKRKQNRATGNAADADAKIDQSDQPEDSQRFQSSPQIDDQRRDHDLPGTDHSLPDFDDLHSRNGVVRKSDSSGYQQADLRSGQQHRDSAQADRNPPQVNRPKSSDSIEQKQQFYDQLWHHYNQGLRASLYPLERDVEIATKALKEHEVDQVRCVIVRGAEAQSYIRAGNREGAFSYVDRIVATAQEKQLSPEQRDLAQFVVKTIDQLLNRVGKDEYEGPNYKTQRNLQTRSLTLEAKDGRGIILQQQQGAISRSNLNQKDYEFFQEINWKLQTYQAPSQRSISKSSQLEIGD